MDYSQYCDQLVTQAALLNQHLVDADLSTPVPSCPGWNVGQLVRHVGGAHREAEYVVRNGQAPGDDDFRDPTHFSDSDPEKLGGWLVEGARHLAAALRDAGPDKAVATPVADQSTKFIARRMTHEKAAVAVRGTVLDLLLLIYKRRPVDTVEVIGDAGLLDFYLDRVSFG